VKSTVERLVRSGARRVAMSAKPTPAHHARSSPSTTPTAAPGRRFSLTYEAALASSFAATGEIGSTATTILQLSTFLEVGHGGDQSGGCGMGGRPDERSRTSQGRERNVP